MNQRAKNLLRTGMAVALFTGSILTYYRFQGAPSGREQAGMEALDAAGVRCRMPGVAAARDGEEQVPDREIFTKLWGRSGRAELDAFARWAEDFLLAAPEDRAGLLAQGRELAALRQGAVRQLIRQDPRGALANTPPLRLRQALPAEIQSLLEERVSGTGNVGLIYSLSAPGSTVRPPPQDIALVNGQQFTAYRYGWRQTVPGLQQVSIHGVALEGHLAVSGSPVKVLEPGESYTELEEDCVVTDNKQVLAPGETPDQQSTALVGTHAYVMCCPFCMTTFEAEKIEEESAIWQRPLGLGDSGVPGTRGFAGKPAVSRTFGGKGVLIMRVRPTDADFPADATETALQEMIFGAEGWNERLKRMSYNNTWFARGDVTPVLTLPRNAAYYTGNAYEFGRWVDDAKTVSAAAGYNLANYATFVVLHRNYPQYEALGWGDTTGAGTIWSNGSSDVRLYVHEGGHTFGLPHANSWISQDGNPLSAARTHLEYGDDSDPMGNAWLVGPASDYNAYYKSFCSWMPDSTVLSVSHPGTYRIRQFDGGNLLTGSPLALKISRDSDMDFWVMYRGAAVPQTNFRQGAYVVGVPVGRVGDSHVIDMNSPQNNTADAPLAVGQTFTDTVSGVSLTTAGYGGQEGDRYLYVKADFAPGYTGPHRLLVEGGIYAFRNKSFNRYLTVPGNSALAGVEPVLASLGTTTSQQWVVKRNTDGSYGLNHAGTDQWLEVSGGANANYTEIIQGTLNASRAQHWDLLLMADGFIKLRKRGSTQVLTADTAAANSADVITYDDYSPGTEQRWEPVLLGMTPGTYRLAPRHAQAYGMGVAGQTAAAGAAVQQQTWLGHATQRWTLTAVGNGQLRLHPADQPGMTLAVAGGGAVAGSRVVLVPWTGGNEQKWTFVSTGNGWVRFSPVHAAATCLQSPSASAPAMAGLELGNYSGATHQQWKFVDPDL